MNHWPQTDDQLTFFFADLLYINFRRFVPSTVCRILRFVVSTVCRILQSVVLQFVTFYDLSFYTLSFYELSFYDLSVYHVDCLQPLVAKSAADTGGRGTLTGAALDFGTVTSRPRSSI